MRWRLFPQDWHLFHYALLCASLKLHGVPSIALSEMISLSRGTLSTEYSFEDCRETNRYFRLFSLSYVYQLHTVAIDIGDVLHLFLCSLFLGCCFFARNCYAFCPITRTVIHWTALFNVLPVYFFCCLPDYQQCHNKDVNDR